MFYYTGLLCLSIPPPFERNAQHLSTFLLNTHPFCNPHFHIFLFLGSLDRENGINKPRSIDIMLPVKAWIAPHLTWVTVSHAGEVN